MIFVGDEKSYLNESWDTLENLRIHLNYNYRDFSEICYLGLKIERKTAKFDLEIPQNLFALLKWSGGSDLEIRL